MGIKRSISFLATLLTVITVAVSMLYAGSSVYGEEDASPPDTQIVAGPSGAVDGADVTFSWTGGDDTTPVSGLEYSFSLQGYETGWSDWASATTKSYADLPGGGYTFSVKARDLAGNADPTPAVTDFYVSWSFAVLTDLHIGREFTDYDGPGWNDSGTPLTGEAAGYAQDAVNEINKLADSQNIAFAAVLGDMTNQAELSQLRTTKLIFDNLTVPWIPVIGNHDGWPMTDNTGAPNCCPPPDSYFDSIMGPEYARLASEMSGWGKESPAMVYDPERERDHYFENFFFDYGGFHFVFLDLNRDGWRAGELHDFPGGTWYWFKQHMEQFVQMNPERSRDVILLAHHPMRDDGLSGASTFTAVELDQISSFTRDTSYSYVDSSGITQTRPYSSRIWGQLAGHTHPYRLEVDYPAWCDGGPVITYPRNFGSVQMSVIKVTSDMPTGVDYSRPAVATEEATSVSAVSATLNGYVASRGTAASLQVSFEWGPTTDYGHATTPQTNSGGSFSASVSGLDPDTTYHFRAKAAGNGTAYGSDMTFTTTTTPHVTTDPADHIGATSAILNGHLDSLGTATTVNVCFEWGPTTDYGNATTPKAMTGNDTFSASASGLTPDATYHFRAKAVGNGTAYGADMTFTTSMTPHVTTNPADHIGATSAILNGYLYSLGTATSVNVSFEWGPTTDYGHATTAQTNSGGSFSAGISGLAPGTTYHFHAKAVGDADPTPFYGVDMSFTTSTTPPTVTTNAAGNLAATSATLNGNLGDPGTASSVTVSFEWGLTTSYGSPAAGTPPSMSAPGTFTANLTGLTAGTTYHFRAIADGDGDPVYGSDMSFTTSTTQPSVTTDNATSIATTSATLNGNLTAKGTADNVTVSFEYGTTSGGSYTPVAAGSKDAIGTFSANLSGLTPGATYYYRAVADGDGDPVYGLEQSFIASTTPPTVSTSAATSLATTSATLNGSLESAGTATSVNVSFEWGTSTSYGSETTAQTVTAGAFTANLTGLTAGTTYHFRAKAVGHGSAVHGEDKTFTTAGLPDTTAPVITQVTASEESTSSVTIEWTTDERATGEVEYGLTADYGSAATADMGFIMSHSVELTGLKAGKTYHFRVISKDASNNESTSADSTFKTASKSGGMPVWAWTVIVFAVVGVPGAAAFLIKRKTAEG